jgi:predicted dehydrogenase
MKRREFIKQVAQATAAVSTMSAFSAERVIGANDRVNVALIGCGGRGRLVSRLMREAPNVDFVAVCDVYDPSAASAKEWAGPNAKSFRDFRKALEMKEVDAVLVATPDHWHAIPTVLACQAGKDVYVEKPLGLTIREGRAIVEAARRNNRVVQTGMQHRSAPHYKEIEDIIQSGQIGEVHFVHVCNYSTVYTGAGAAPADSDPPEGLDWDFYLGPAPKVPYNNLRFRTYRRFYDYSGGFITDFGAHRLDSVHQVMHDDRPLSAMGVGGLYGPKSIVDTPNVLHVTYEYKNWILSYEGIQLNGFGTGPRIAGGRVPYNASGTLDRPHGEAFHGTKGTIFSDRVGYELFPAGRGSTAAPKSVVGRDCTDSHTRNFIDCVRSRQRPVADVETGHKSTIVPHLGNISYKVGGRKIRWDPEKEQILDDPQASALLARQARAPWNLI